jgi:hypothetical protein
MSDSMAADHYVAVRASVVLQKPVGEVVNELDPSAIEATVPRARLAYENRMATAARLGAPLGIDVTAPDFAADLAVSRRLRQVDGTRGSDSAA